MSDGKVVSIFPDIALFHPAPAELILDVDADDLLETLFGTKAERQRPLGCEIARPALDDLHDRLIRPPDDPVRHPVAGDLAERRDLLGDRDREARHGDVAPRADIPPVELRP